VSTVKFARFVKLGVTVSRWVATLNPTSGSVMRF
jgi:hypothetical protein